MKAANFVPRLQSDQFIRIAVVVLTLRLFLPSWGIAGGGGHGGGGGVRGQSGAPRIGRAPSPHATAAPHAASAPHGNPPAPHGGPSAIHGGNIGSNHNGHFDHTAAGGHAMAGGHHPEMLHQPGPHWNGYHQAYVGNRAVHLAWAGYRPSYYYHPWYHGPWGGYAWGWGWGFGPGLSFGIGGGGFAIAVSSGWGYPVYPTPYGAYGYWGRPLGWGFGGWGLGTTVYTSGYYPYYNPYYYPPASTTIVYNYSQPICVATLPPPVDQSESRSTVFEGTSFTSSEVFNSPPPDNTAFDMARASFKRGDYTAALRDVDAALRKSNTDAVMHEFRSLTLFALRDYRQSAAVAHSVLAVGPGWDYITMASLYPDPFTYSEQLQKLVEYSHDHPRAAEAHFLLAYHEMIASRKEEAAAELQQVVKLMPSDRLASELLTMVKGPKKSNPAHHATANHDLDSSLNDPNVVPSPSDDDSGEISPIDKDFLAGTWNASRDDGTKFRLTLSNDGRFTWVFAPPNHKAEEFSGNYSIDGAVLILERKEGGALAGTVNFHGPDKMTFKLVGGPPEDQGLDFGKIRVQN